MSKVSSALGNSSWSQRQALFPIHQDLDPLGRVRGKTTPRRLGTSPLHHHLPLPETAPDPFVDRAMQQTVGAPPQRVHDHEGGTTAILVLSPFFPAFFRAPPLPPRPSAMTLTTASTTLAVPPRPAPLEQLGRARHRCRLAVHLDHQHLPLLLGKRRCRTHVRWGHPTHPQHQMLQRFGGRRPTPERRQHQLRCLEAQPRRQARRQRDHPRRKRVAGQAQDGIERMKTPTAAPPCQVRSCVADRAVNRLQLAWRPSIHQAMTAQPSLQIQPLVSREQKQRDEQAAQHPHSSEQFFLEIPKGCLATLTPSRDLLDLLMDLPANRLDRIWTITTRWNRLDHGGMSPCQRVFGHWQRYAPPCF